MLPPSAELLLSSEDSKAIEWLRFVSLSGTGFRSADSIDRIQRMSLHAFQPHLSSIKPARIVLNTCYGTLRLDVQPDAMFDPEIHSNRVIITRLDNYLSYWLRQPWQLGRTGSLTSR